MLLIPSVALVALLVVAVLHDIRERRIPNMLNLAVLLLGLLYATLVNGAIVGGTMALLGVLAGVVIWFPMFSLRLLGAGDAKLMAASSAWLGWQGSFTASLVTGVAGGVLGAVWLIRRHGLGRAAHAVGLAVRDPAQLRMHPFDARERIPYAIPVAVGVLVAWWIETGFGLTEVLR